MKNKTLLFLSGVWILATLSLAGWWIYSFQTILATIESGAILQLEKLQSYRSMILWEGLAWMLLLIVGGGSLVYYILKEKRDAQKIKEFMAAFSHDLKTSLASMRLQAESLEADIATEPEQKVIQRLVKDTVRLQFQLENTMAYSDMNDQCFFEIVSLNEIIKSLKHYWPSIQVIVDPNLSIFGDKHKLESVLKNAIQNAAIHGGASIVKISKIQNGFSIADNGKGFQGEIKRAGELFFRHNSTSGSGLGLHIVKTHIQSMKGTLSFSKTDCGFCIEAQFSDKELL